MSNKYLKIFIKTLPFLFLILVSLIPVYYTRGKLAIGGDTILPFNPEGVQKFLWQWYGSENGQYFSQNLAPLYLIYKIAAYFSLSLTTTAAIILFTLNFISGLAIYKLCKLIYQPENPLYLSFPIVFYVISPALLNSWRYCFIYAFAPWFVYFVIKILITRRITIRDLVLSNFVIFFASIDLPNPKYLFFLFIFLFSAMIMALTLKIINLKSIARNWWKAVLFSVYLFYLIIPLIFFALSFSPGNYKIHIKQNYSDTGLFMDENSSTINRMVQLHHSGLNINARDRIAYNASKKVVFAGSVFFICILLGLLFKKKKPKFEIELIFLALVCLFLFFAVGPNPPFGQIYKTIVSRIGALAFLRTTAGAVFFLSIFYSVLLFGFIENFKGKSKLIITILLTVALLVSSYPLINGKFYQNLDVVGNMAIDTKSHGVNLPKEYFDMKKVIDEQKIDGKLLSLKNDLAYMNTTWGYFGPSVYNFMFDYYNIGYNNIFSTPENHSVAYTLDDKSLITNKNVPSFKVDNTTKVQENNLLILSSVASNRYLPHFWIPKQTYSSNEPIGDLIQDSNQNQFGNAVYLVDQNKSSQDILSALPKTTEDKPTLEYKKINPTKYRVIVHGAKKPFPLIFNESSNKYWKIYLEKHVPIDTESLTESLSRYNQFRGDENFQATKEETGNYIRQGFISELKSGESLDFISKNMAGTIQNNNLDNGSFLETWFQKSILDDKRLTANGYSNSWLMDPNTICGQSNLCQINSDSSFDYEIVAEFLPQRIYWTSLLVSISAVFVSVIYLLAIGLIAIWKKR